MKDDCTSDLKSFCVMKDEIPSHRKKDTNSNRRRRIWTPDDDGDEDRLLFWFLFSLFFLSCSLFWFLFSPFFLSCSLFWFLYSLSFFLANLLVPFLSFFLSCSILFQFTMTTTRWLDLLPATTMSEMFWWWHDECKQHWTLYDLDWWSPPRVCVTHIAIFFSTCSLVKFRPLLRQN